MVTAIKNILTIVVLAFDWGTTGLERKIPRVFSRVGAIQCLSPLSLEDLELLSPTEGGEELARCLEEVSIAHC